MKIMVSRSHGLSLLAVAVFCLHPIAARAEPISPHWVAKWRTDLAFAADSVPRAHPNFFHSISREAYRAALDSLSLRLPQLEQHQIVVELARIIALVGDGHTRLTYPFDPGTGFFTGHATTATPKIPGLVFRHYPIRFALFADTLWVVRADSSHRDLLGGRLVSLGTRSGAEAVAAIEPTIQRDNDSQVRNLLPTSMVCPEILYARGVVADMERAPIVVQQRSGATVASMLSPVTPGVAPRWFEAREPGPAPLRDRNPERNHWFVRVPGAPTFYARYRGVQDDKDETVAQFGDSLFAAIEEARADRLVIDLRGNVGGDGSLNRTLLQHLIRARRLWRPGGLWALIDRGSFSAAVMLAADLELRTPTLLVGKKTGGHPNSYGDSRRVVLPNTGLTIRVSSLYWQLTGPNDPRDGITPHVSVTERFEDWRMNRDPALEAALARDDTSRDFSGPWKGEVGWQSERLAMRLTLERHGAAWAGRYDAPDAGVEDTPLTEVRVSGPELLATGKFGSERWSLSGRWAGERVVGIVRHKGLDFPAVLERAARTRP